MCSFKLWVICCEAEELNRQFDNLCLPRFFFVGYSASIKPPLQYARVLIPRHWVCTGIFISFHDSEFGYKIIPNLIQALICLNLAVFQVNTEGQCHHLFTVRDSFFLILKWIQHFWKLWTDCHEHYATFLLICF